MNTNKSNNRTITKLLMTSALALSLTGCGSIPFLNDEPDYKGSGRSRPLEVPPDLTDAPVSGAYSIPGSTTYSDYSKSQQDIRAAKPKILATPDNVKMVKAGSQRWLEVKAPVEDIWPKIREFWEEQGFAVRKEQPQIGVMETEWINPDKLNLEEDGNYGERFDKWLDSLSGLTNRKKFKTRVERGETSEVTEIFMTHRSIDAHDDGKNRVQTQMGEIDLGYKKDARKRKLQDATDDELDAELLRRLMVKLGIEESDSKNIVANTQLQKRANVIKNDDGSATIEVLDAYDRAWRRVGLAIDRVGFVIEDKDRSKGLFYVRYADVDIDTPDKKKKGLLETLKFWGDDEEEVDPEQAEKESVMDKLKFWGSDDTPKVAKEGYYRVKVSEFSSKLAHVNVLDENNEIMKTRTANRIVALIYEQLR